MELENKAHLIWDVVQGKDVFCVNKCQPPQICELIRNLS